MIHKKNTFAYITCLSVCGMVVEVMWCVVLISPWCADCEVVVVVSQVSVKNYTPACQSRDLQFLILICYGGEERWAQPAVLVCQVQQ